MTSSSQNSKALRVSASADQGESGEGRLSGQFWKSGFRGNDRISEQARVWPTSVKRHDVNVGSAGFSNSKGPTIRSVRVRRRSINLWYRVRISSVNSPSKSYKLPT